MEQFSPHWNIVDNPADFVKIYIMVVAVNLCILCQLWHVKTEK